MKSKFEGKKKKKKVPNWREGREKSCKVREKWGHPNKGKVFTSGPVLILNLFIPTNFFPPKNHSLLHLRQRFTTTTTHPPATAVAVPSLPVLSFYGIILSLFVFLIVLHFFGAKFYVFLWFFFFFDFFFNCS